MTAKSTKKPNVLWICTDQQRFDTLGCYGNSMVQTPNIDRLAQMGVLFERAYCQNPVCSPSRASFLTGRYPRTTRLRQNGQTIPADERLIPRILADDGYVCGLSGKLHLSACHPTVCKTMENRINDGYVSFNWSHDHNNPAMMNEYQAWLRQNGVEYKTPVFDEEAKQVLKGMPSEYHQTTWCTQQAIDFISNAHHHGRSWLFSLNIFDPHHPFDPPVDYLERYLDKLDDIPLPDYIEGELESKPVFIRKDHNGAYDDPKNIAFSRIGKNEHKLLRAAYWAMVDLIDVQVGRLLDLLEATGQLENTLIIFMSDHGEMLGDHGMYLKGPHFYEQALHVPLIMAWPGTIDGGRRSEGLIELVDIAPTLLDAAGISPEPGMQGKSLWPLLQGVAPLDYHRDDVYCEYYNSNLNHRTPLAFATMVSDGRHKLVKVHGKPEEVLWNGELYDLENDPGEHVNQWNNPSYAEVKMRLLERLCDRMAETCDPLPIREAMF